VRNLALGVIGGLLLGIGAAFLAERLDPVHHSADEIKEDTKLPLLGAIPWQKDLGTIEKSDHRRPTPVNSRWSTTYYP
jgi:hypothetical protein